MNLYGIVCARGNYDDNVFAFVARNREEAIQRMKKHWFDNYQTELEDDNIYIEYETDLDDIISWPRSFD